MFGWCTKNIFGLRKHHQSQLTDTDIGHTGSSWDTQLVPCHHSKKGCRKPLSVILNWHFGHNIRLLERDDKPPKGINLNDVSEALLQTLFLLVKVVMKRQIGWWNFGGPFSTMLAPTVINCILQHGQKQQSATLPTSSPSVNSSWRH